MSSYIEVLKKYAVFSGRAHRKEFWTFFVISISIVVILTLIEQFAGLAPDSRRSVIASIYQLAVLIPSIAVGVRRMHDSDHSGWWLLVPIVNLVFALSDGTRGVNKHGPDPKGASPVGVV